RRTGLTDRYCFGAATPKAFVANPCNRLPFPPASTMGHVFWIQQQGIYLRYCITHGRIGPWPNLRTRDAPAACVEARMWSPSIFATIFWSNGWLFSYYKLIKIKSVYSFCLRTWRQG